MTNDTRAWTSTRLHTLLPLLLLAPLACDPDDDGDSGANATEGETGGHDHDTGDHEGESGHDSGESGQDSGESGQDSDESEEDSGGEGIAIAGTWIETYRGGMVTHTIDDAMWTQDDSEFGPFELTLVSFDNTAQTAIADDGMAFSKLQWTWTDDDTQLWYCTAAFGAASAEEAEAADDADPSDPATGGCGQFAWSMLSPG